MRVVSHRHRARARALIRLCEACPRDRPAAPRRPPRATSPRCARAARCPACSRPTTTGCTSRSSRAPARARARWSPRSSPASSRARSASTCRSSSSSTSPPELGHAEPDPEIQELLAASPGLNLGMDFLPGSLPFSLPADPPVDPALRRRRRVVRRARDERRPHAPQPEPARLGPADLAHRPRRRVLSPARRAAARRRPRTTPCRCSAEHVLLPLAGPIREADERLAARALAAVGAAVALVPDVWLGADPAARRGDLAAFLDARLARAARVRRGGRACPPLTRSRSPTRCCASSRASSAASG